VGSRPITCWLRLSAPVLRRDRPPPRPHQQRRVATHAGQHGVPDHGCNVSARGSPRQPSV